MITAKQEYEYQKELYLLNEEGYKCITKHWWYRFTGCGHQHIYRKPLPPIDESFRSVK